MSDPVLELHSGQIRGVVEKHEDGFDYYAFKGIPYAKPPIGDLRFEDAIPIEKWTGILDCKNYGPIGCSFDFILETLYHDENSLHLNVYTRTINPEDKKTAVLVWVPNGDFGFCNSTDAYFGPEYLIRKNIVLVTVSFRTSILGFLNLDDEVAPGNQGLKDLIVALQWVQKNIHVFGGDPANVTFGGGTQGGVAAHLLALSPLTKGLMHRIICQSGVAYNPWFVAENSKANAIKLCSLLGKDLQDPKEIKSFLKTINIVDLMAAFKRVWHLSNAMVFGPAYDSKSSNPVMPIDRFVAADKAIHLPALVGNNKNCGMIFLSDHVTFRNIPREEFFALTTQDFRPILQRNAKEVLKNYNLNAVQIKRLYYKNESVSESNIDIFVDYCTDMYIRLGIHRFAGVQAVRGSAPTYLYEFTYEPPDPLHNCYLKNVPNGVSMLDELPFLFKMRLFDQIGIEHHKKGTQGYRLMEQMTEMWANFIIHGKPTVETSDLIPVHWQPISDGTLLRHLNIDEDLTMQLTVNIEQKLISARQIKT